MPYALTQIPAVSSATKVIDLVVITASIIGQNPQFMAELVNKQLYSGKDKAGNPLAPLYSQDPFFKTADAAARYAAWKQRITPDPDRPADVPNLFITGKYHSGLKAVVSGDTVDYINSDSNAQAIESKFGGRDKLYGLNDEGKAKFREYVLPQLRDALSNELRKAIGYG